MDIPEIFPSEYKLMQEIWEYGPIKASDLTRVCERKYGRSKSTTYTNISRLIKRGVLKKQNGIIYAAYSKECIEDERIDAFIQQVCQGSATKSLEVLKRYLQNDRS